MDESKKITAVFRDKREFLERAFSSDYFHKSDEDLNVGERSMQFKKNSYAHARSI